MKVPEGVILAFIIFPIILGSPLAFKNQNEDSSNLDSEHINQNSAMHSKSRITSSRETSDSMLYKKLQARKPEKVGYRRTTKNISGFTGVTEIYMPVSRYLSRGFTPVVIYHEPIGPDDNSSIEEDFEDQDYEDSDSKGRSDSSLHEDDKVDKTLEEVGAFKAVDENSIQMQKNTQLEKDQFTDDNKLKENSDPESDYDESEEEDEDDEESEYDYEDDTEYADGPEEEYSRTHSDFSTANEASNPEHNSNQGCPHHGANQNTGHHGQYPNRGYQGQYYNSRDRGYDTNAGYQAYYPRTSNEVGYPDRRYHGHPSAGYQGYHPNRGYQGNLPYPYRGYQGPHLDNNYNSQPHRGQQGHPNRGHQGPHPNRGYQGPYPYPYSYGYQGPPSDRSYQGNYVNQNEDHSNCDHAHTNLGRDNNEQDTEVDSGVENDNSIDEENPDYSGSEYYDDEEDDEYDEYEGSDKQEVSLESNVTFASNAELAKRKGHNAKDIMSVKTDMTDEIPNLNDESSDPKSNMPSELHNVNELDNKSKKSDSKVDLECVKTIKNKEKMQNVTDTDLLVDCTETSENNEGNKSGRLLDIFTRTNISVECTTPKNESGLCKSFSECPIGNIMDNYNMFLQYMCLRGVFVGICCPDNPVLETSDPDNDNTTESPLDIQQPTEGCGLSQKTRIVGGTISAPHEWTWMVALMRRNRFFCGGVIINNWYILTAAHCVLGVNVKDLKVRLGEYNFMERNEHQHDINVAEIKRHALFVTATFQHDIALLKLKRRIEYSKFIGSICLPDTNARSYSDDKATVVGWGTVSFGGAASPILRQVTVPVWDNEDCDRTYFLESIDDSFLCAGSTENGEDACQGDSGGPLMTLNPDNRWEVIGIVSWGRRCGDPTYPGVYTRVTSYLDWISIHAK